jgi:hypothetical protein
MYRVVLFISSMSIVIATPMQGTRSLPLFATVPRYTVTSIPGTRRLPLFATGRRYPVGYDPDNRSNPNYYSTDTNETQVNVGSGVQQSARELIEDPPTLRPRPKWSPPKGYDPKHRILSRNMEDRPHTNFVHASDVENEIDFDEDGHHCNNKIRVCSGIWVNRKIICKRCVYMHRDL